MSCSSVPEKWRRVILLDGKMMAYRAHFSHLGLRNRDGHPTGLLHGFIWELLRINKKLPDTPMVICWDGDGKTWRHRLYPKYKANRKLNPEWKRMKMQIDELLPMLDMLGFEVVRIPGVEADDVIGILSSELNAHQIIVYTLDRDMLQLIRDGVCVWPKFDQRFIRTKDVEKKFGVPLGALTQIRAMVGDPSDNLKGLPGVGPVTAVKLWKAGFRLSDMSNGKLWSKYRSHILQLRKEFQLVQIIRSTDDEVWTEEQRAELKEMVTRIDWYPGRKQRKAMKHKDEFYHFLGRFALKELFAQRHDILSLP
jgi:DNA polymerase-1